MNEKEFIMWLKGYLEGTLSNNDSNPQNKILTSILNKIHEIESSTNGKLLLKERVLSPYAENKSTT